MGRGALAAMGAIVVLWTVPDAGAALRAGAASADITPPVGTPMFAYTARSAIASPDKLPSVVEQLVADPPSGRYATTFVPSRGIHTRVRARALVLDADRGRFALVQADLGGVPGLLTDEVLRRVADLGITADRLLLSATHTHSSTGPIWPTDSSGYALLGGDLFDPRIFRLTADGVAEAIRTAVARMAPARAGVGSVALRGASRNRNFTPFRANADVPKEEGAARSASIDPTLTVLRVERPDGRPVAVWSNFAVHPTSFGDDNLLFSGDNAGVAERVAERAITRDAPRKPDDPVVNVWTNGAEGDVSPDGSPEDPERDPAHRGASTTALQAVPNAFASTHLAGTRVGRGIAAAWAAAAGDLRDTIDLDARLGYVALDGTSADGEPVGPIPVLGAGGVVGPDGMCAPDGTAGPGQGPKFPLVGAPGLAPGAVPISVWRIGTLGVAAFPSEITTQMGRRLATAVREAAGLRQVVIAGLTNGYVSYTATPEEYDACHYEGSFTLFGRRQGARLRDAATGLAAALTAGGPAPSGAAPTPVLAPPGGLLGAAPRDTPRAGGTVREPDERVRRPALVTFSWHGGDPQVDAPRGRAFVTLQRRESGAWQTVGTDDSFQDTVERSSDGVWTQRHQFAECDRPGTYRFVVHGVAMRDGAIGSYTTTSRAFALERSPLEPATPTVSGRIARFRVAYPDPGKEMLLALPRRVRSGSAVLRVRARGRVRRVRARPDGKRLTFAARVPAGARVTLLGVHDRCGNGQGPRR